MQQISRNKVVVNERIEAMKQRGQYRYDNMPKAEKEAYVAKFGPAPKHPGPKASIADVEKYGTALRKWAAQAEGQKPYVPAKRG